MSKFEKLFGRLKSVIIGMVHVRALPGSPRSSQTLEAVTRIACAEAMIYRKAKVDAIMVENMHDLPWYLPHQMGPETIAFMSIICSAIRRECPDIPIGVQVLSAANREALAVAKAADLNFIRAEGFVYSHIGDEGPIHSCAADLVRYRHHIGADHVQIFTDIKKKHSSHAITSDVSLVDTAKAAELFMSDGLIVSGTATGEPTNPQEVQDVQSAVELPVLVGSGVSEDNLGQYITANGIIIGSSLKLHGQWSNELDRNKVDRFMQLAEKIRSQVAEADPAEKEPFAPILGEGE